MNGWHEVCVNGARVGDPWPTHALARAFAEGFAEGSCGVEPEVVPLPEKSTGAPASEHDGREALARGYVTGEAMARRGELGRKAQRVLALREQEHRILYGALVHRLCNDGRAEVAAKLTALFPEARSLAKTDDAATLTRALVTRLRREGSVELARAVAALLVPTPVD